MSYGVIYILVQYEIKLKKVLRFEKQTCFGSNEGKKVMCLTATS